MPRLRRPRECLVGRRFVRLTVVEYVPGRRGITAKWKCVCDCGAGVTTGTYGLLRGRTKSCGCLRREKADAWRAKLKDEGWRKKLPEHAVWSSMKARCLNPKRKDYASYGGRGISVCAEWMAFDRFFADMGPRPTASHSLERLDNDGPYAKWNCAWVDILTQANNRRNSTSLSANGETMTIPMWARRLECSAEVIKQRLKMGWSPERAVTQPLRR